MGPGVRSIFSTGWVWPYSNSGLRTASGLPTKATPLAPASEMMESSHGDAAVVLVDEDGVAADLVDRGFLDRAVFRAVEEDGPAAIRGPVAAQERLLVVHEGAGGVAEGDSLERDEADGFLLRAAELDQMAEADDLDGGGIELHVGGRIEIER